MTTTTFEIGDTVQLKSGGPIMTVNYAGTDAKQEVTVLYFDAEGKLHGHINSLKFKAAVLKKVA
jgi:uncharacterized protein YodC (DUF2158 family)